MNQRKLAGGIAFVLLILVALALEYIAKIPQDDWGPAWKIAFGLALCIAFGMTFYDRRNFPEKTWDFNPKRGALYFMLGWIIFPLMMIVEALSGADFTIGTMVLFTLAMSVLVGIVGTFTENVGI